MNPPHSSSQPAIGETAAGSKTPPILRLGCGPQIEDFTLSGEAGFKGEEVEALAKPFLQGDSGHMSVFLQAL